jgi:hypothetical protein
MDLSHGSRKQLQKKVSRKRKAANAHSGLSASTSKRARITMEDTPSGQASGLSASSSMISIESLVRKVCIVRNVVCSLCLIQLVLCVQPAVKRNPIYIFYEAVPMNSQGQAGNPGDKHYKCYHGNRKVITVTRAMKYSLNGKQPLLLFTDVVSQKSIVGLVGHLKTHFPAQYRLYLILKDRTDPPTDEDLAIASGEKVLDAEAANAYLRRVEVAASANLLSMFAKQTQVNAVSRL